MLPLLIALGVGGFLAYRSKKSSTALPPRILVAPKSPQSPPIVSIPPGQAVPKGALTEERAAIHGDLIANCVNPQKLAKAAHLFGAEGLPIQAQQLLQKAATLHDMMHGAKSIVERCRTGDQHAMAIAKGIGERAREGNKRAQVSAWLIERYTQKHPAPALAPTVEPQHPAITQQ